MITRFFLNSACAVAVIASSASSAFADTMPRDQRLAQVQTIIANYDAGIPGVREAWPGYDPVAIPKIIVMRDGGGAVQALIAMDHPNPDQLGEAIAVPSAHGVVYLIVNPRADLGINDIEYFEFSRRVAGANTFLIASNCGLPDDPSLCAANPDYVPYLLHEAFHRYQDEAFGNQVFADQSVYNYTPEFLHATLIENHLFHLASKEDDPAELRELAQELVGVRAYRHNLTPVVLLDEVQERFEGTANLVEKHASDLGANIPVETLTQALQQGYVRDELGFDRFYVTGRVAIETAERLGASNYAARITAKESPMQVLASMVEPIDSVAAFDRAKQRFDPNQKLLQIARRYAAWAQDEPDIFAE